MTMSFKWQDKHMELFLESYKQYECLWNNKCSDYSKSNARERAYSLMLSDLNIPRLTVGDIKAKIKTIRTRYGAELAKIRNSQRNGAADNEVYEPRLFWFKDADEFLRKVCTSKPNYSMVKDQEVTEKEVSTEKITTIDPQNNDDNDATSPENSRNSPEAEANLSNTCANNFKYRRNAWKRSLPNSSNVPEVNRPNKRFKQISEDNHRHHQDPNEFDVFCHSLAIQLKKMPLQRAIICQEKLQSVMTQERLFQLSDSSNSSLPNAPNYQYRSLGNNTQNSDTYFTISSTEPRIDSVIGSDSKYYESNDEGDSINENISEVKREI